jgi:signal transduction histidine kinase
VTAHPVVVGAVPLVFLVGGALALPHRDQPGTLAYVALMGVLAVLATVLAGATGTGYVPVDTAARVLVSCMYVAWVLWAVFAIEYTGRGPVMTRPRAVGLLLVGALSGGLPLATDMFGVSSPNLSLFLVPLQIATIALAAFGVFLVARSGVTYDDLSPGRSVSLTVAGTSLTAVLTVPSTANLIGTDQSFLLALGLLGVAGVAFLVGQVRLGVFDSDPSTGYLARETVLDQMSQAVFLVDRGGQLLDVNDTAAETFGIDRPIEHGQWLGAVLGTTLPAGTEDPITLGTRAGEREFACRSSDLTRGGDTVGSIHVLRDVTERRTDEQRLAVLNRVLRHNLRNDLDAIRAFAESLRDADADGVDTAELAARIEETARGVASIGETVDRADTLLQSDGTDRKQIGVERLAGQVVARQVTTDADATGEVSGSAGQITTDPRILEAVLAELVENALTHSDRPDPRVEVEVRETETGVELSVRDNGPGIPDHERAVLLEGEETPLNHGSGLGLWLVYWGVKRLGGSLTFGSAQPTGSVVTVAVPSLEAEAPTPVAATE